MFRLVAASALIAQLLAAALATGQQVTSSRQAGVGGSSKQATKTNSNQSPLQTGDQLAAPFYSIKDGKTSARRIQQQQQQQQQQLQSMSGSGLNEPLDGSGGSNPSPANQASSERGNWIPSTTVSTVSTSAAQINNDNNRDEFPANPSQSSAANANGFNEDNVKRLINDRRPQQQQQVTALNAGSDSSDQQPTMATIGDQTAGNENSIAQQRMLINSFNQLVGSDGAIDDFLSSTTTTTTTTTTPAPSSATSNRFEAGNSASFEQQRGNSFTPTTTISSASESAFKPAKQATKSAAGRLVGGQSTASQQLAVQFTTATGAPLSTPPSSLSMSLDGMIVNSRPRSSSSASGEPSSFERLAGGSAASGKKKLQAKSALSANTQSPARMGELASTSGSGQQGSLNGATKVSRRVPFSGAPFSSPATKGQRSRPSQQVGGLFGAGQQAPSSGMSNGIFGPQAGDLMAGLQQFDSATMVLNGGRRPMLETSANSAITTSELFKQSAPVSSKPLIEQLNMGNFVQQEQQLDTNLLQGFDEDQQQTLRPLRVNGFQNQQADAANGEAALDANTLELMKNLMNSGSVRDQLESAGLRGSNANMSSLNDMVMSMVSSIDGKERRLVMIARNDLDSLQRIAMSQQQQQQQSGSALGSTKKQQDLSNQSIRRPAQQQTSGNFNGASTDSSSANGQPNNWWPSGGQMGTWAPSTSGQQSLVTTLAPFRDSSQTEQQQQQEVQLQTTTAAPSNLFSSSASITTVAPQTATGSATQFPDFGQAKMDTQTEPSRKNELQSSASTNSSATGDDSFREVPVSSLLESSVGADRVQSSKQRSQGFGGSGKQQASSAGNESGVRSKTNSGKAAGSPSSARVSGANGATNSSPKSSSKQQAGGSQQRNKNGSSSGTKSGGSGKRKNNGGSPGGRQTVGASNGKQKSDKTSGSKSTSGGSGRKTPSSGNQSGAGQSNRQQQQQSVDSQQLSGSVKVTNGQQQPAAMRVLEQQSAAGEAQQSGKRPSGGVAREDLGAASQSSSSSNGFGSGGKSDNEQVNTEQQTTSSSSSTTSSSVPNNKRQQQATQASQKPSQMRSTGGDGRRQEQWSGQTASRGTTRLNALSDTSRPAEAEFGRGFQSGNPQQGDEAAAFRGDQGEAGNSLDELRAAIPGEPQLDYPIYSAPPKTSFDCMSQSCPGGYYADLETQCQVFHICQNDGRFDTFLCPNGTIFSQQHFVCVWWWQVDCQQSATFYKLNDGIYCNSMFSAPNAAGGLSLNANSADTGTRSNGTVPATGTNKLSFDGPGGELSSNLDAMMGAVTSNSLGESRTDGIPGGSSSISSSSSSSSSLGGLSDGNPNGNSNSNKAQPGAQLAVGIANSDGGSMKQQAGETQPDDADLSQQHIERLVKRA